MNVEELQEIRFNRNFIRVNDLVHVTASKPGKKDGFDAKVRRILRYPDAHIEVEVFGRNAIRTFRLSRIERREQTRNGERIVKRPA